MKNWLKDLLGLPARKSEFFEDNQATLCRLDSNRFACILDQTDSQALKMLLHLVIILYKTRYRLLIKD